MKAPQLLAPAGSFASACQAFEAGADGVYLGLREFSARKAASNFTPEQLRRIRGLAARLGRKIYMTMNTAIRDEEMERFASVLAWLEALEIDGVIVQDLGACRLAIRRFPRLAVHASTQMAIHNDSGLRFAEELGIRRVILSRELPLARIRELRARHPGVELEVFIHGALCYSFSGVCLASWALAGRSANRGNCAQICRSAFCGGGEGPGGHRMPFSCRDLSLGVDVLKLAETGIDALKIEGRMKSPEYVFHVTRLYREILDKGNALSETELRQLEKNVEVTFSRERTKGFFDSAKGKAILTGRYPGHRGTLLGTVSENREREIGLRLQSRLSLHDGIGHWLRKDRDPFIFPVRRITRRGRSVRFAEAEDFVYVPVADGASMPPAGVEVRLFSSRFLDRPEVRESSVPAFRIPIRLRVSLSESAGAGTISCGVSAPFGELSFSREATVVTSTGGTPFAAVLRKHLAESGNSAFTIADLVFENETRRDGAGIFVPPSELKKLRNDLFTALEERFLRTLSDRARGAVHTALIAPTPAAPPAPGASLSRRDELSPPAGRPVPFASLPLAREGPVALSALAGFVFVPLPPVMLDDEAWVATLEGLSESFPRQHFAIGLNNVGHLELAGRLGGLENLFFFIDFYLYVANRQTVSFLRSRVTKLLFIYAWIEGGIPADDQVIGIAEDFAPPLFYSLGCYERHAAGRGQCREECPKDFTYVLRQGRNRFTGIVRDCTTYLFRKENRHG